MSARITPPPHEKLLGNVPLYPTLMESSSIALLNVYKYLGLKAQNVKHCREKKIVT